MSSLYSILWGKKEVYDGWYKEVFYLKNKYYHIKNKQDGFYIVEIIGEKIINKRERLKNIFTLPVDLMFYCGPYINLKIDPCCQKCGGPIYIGLNNVECYVCNQ